MQSPSAATIRPWTPTRTRASRDTYQITQPSAAVTLSRDAYTLTYLKQSLSGNLCYAEFAMRMPDEESGLTTGAKVGIAIGTIAAAFAIAAMVYCVWRRRKAQRQTNIAGNEQPAVGSYMTV